MIMVRNVTDEIMTNMITLIKKNYFLWNLGAKIIFYLKNCHAQYVGLQLVSLIPKHFPYDFIPAAQLFLILIIFFSFNFVPILVFLYFFLIVPTLPVSKKEQKKTTPLQQKKERSDLEKQKWKREKYNEVEFNLVGYMIL